MPELPEEGSVVYADNGKFSPDRAVFRNGQLIGGGDFPLPICVMSNVSKWFYLDEYQRRQKGKSCYSVSFGEAEKMD